MSIHPHCKTPRFSPALPVLIALGLPLAAQGAEVEWANVVNAAPVGNSLVKTGGCDGCDDAGAVSQRQLESGNVYVEFTVPDANQSLIAGIGNEGFSTEEEEIDFGVRIQNGQAEVRENGVARAATQAANGDRFRISIENGVVSYFRNDQGFHTSDQQPQYPLRMDVTLLSLNARVDDVIAQPFGGAGGDTAFTPTPQQPAGGGETVALQWTDVVNATTQGDTLVKTGGCNGCEDAGARSQQALEAGNVYVEFRIPDVSKLLWVGLTNERSNIEDENLDFAIRTQNGTVEVRENGEYVSSTQAANNDLFRISVENGVVSYYRNGEAFHTSANQAEYPLFLATTLADEGAAVANAIAVRFQGGAGIALQ